MRSQGKRKAMSWSMFFSEADSITVSRRCSSYRLTQSRWVGDVLMHVKIEKKKPIDTPLYQIDTHFLKERRGTFACTYSLYTQLILFYTSLIHFYTTLIHFFKKKEKGNLWMHIQSLYPFNTFLCHIDTLLYYIDILFKKGRGNSLHAHAIPILSWYSFIPHWYT